MKVLRLSLATALALGTSAYAVDLANIKVSGEATLYYQTTDDSAVDNQDLLKKDNSKANVGIGVKFEADLGNDFHFGARLNAIETLGLEHNLVSGTMQGVNDVATQEQIKVRLSSGGSADVSGLDGDEWYWGEAYLIKKVGSTLVKAGRQELDTPLLYSEKWNVMPTTFDAAVIVNQSVENLTLIGAYVGKHNSHANLGQFSTLVGGAAVDGAYAVAGAYGDDKMKAQLWFYHVPTIANAIWADANTNLAGVDLTAQVATFMFDSDISDADDTTAFAIKGAYSVTEGTRLCLALSQTTGEKTSHSISNIATGGTTKLATARMSGLSAEAGMTDTTAVKFGIKQSLNEYGTAMLNIAQYMHGEDSNAKFADETGMVVEAAYVQKVGGIDLLGAYIYEKNTQVTSVLDDAANSLRVVARYSF
jgi:hypothetical protein